MLTYQSIIKKKQFIRLVVFCFVIFSFNTVNGQEKTTVAEDEPYFRVGVALLHTHLHEDKIEGSTYVSLPSFGLDVEYWFNESFGLGLHNDIEFENHEVETENGDIISRSFPIFLTFDALWKPIHELVVVAGCGYEFAEEENLLVFRVGLEYEIKMDDKWDLSPTLVYDKRNGAYGSWTYGLNIGRSF